MTDTVNILPRSARRTALLPSTLVQSIAGLTIRIGKSVGRFGKVLQVSRMESVLRAMSDSELDAIGVERRDITQHAHYLIGC
ncbi:hypothetical protein [Sulfitobacter sp. MF3-043]|uniref:hypothetical protein n=1 Tax=Sulfitobacter sediminivivens TaxID=3252902 RepID=UPI0036DD358C